MFQAVKGTPDTIQMTLLATFPTMIFCCFDSLHCQVNVEDFEKVCLVLSPFLKLVRLSNICTSWFLQVKFMYSEKATKFWEIFNLILTGTT